jgi:uncharacterized LabA/DUF88 family protein
MSEERKPYAMAFFDGQNLYQHAKAAFGHHHPNFDPIKLHAAVCAMQGWQPSLVRFYTGIPSSGESEMWSAYWSNRVLAMKRNGIFVTTRPLRYRKEQAFDANGQIETITIAQEKGIDVRLALDVVHTARTKQFDVAVIYSQDQDLCEVVSEIRSIAHEQGRQILIACAFPSGPSATSGRGIDKTQWIKVGQTLYDTCLDPHDYRPAPKI